MNEKDWWKNGKLIFFFEKGFFPSRCVTNFCVMICAWETFCRVYKINAITVTCENVRRRSRRKGRRKFCPHWITFLDYSWSSIPILNKATIFSFTLISLSLLVGGLAVWGWKKSMRKKFVGCVMCSLERVLAKKNFLSALALGSFTVHTPLFIVS